MTTRSKALERPLVFIIPSLLQAFLDSHDTLVMREDAMPKTGTQESILMQDSFIRDSFAEVALLSVT